MFLFNYLIFLNCFVFFPWLDLRSNFLLIYLRDNLRKYFWCFCLLSFHRLEVGGLMSNWVKLVRNKVTKFRFIHYNKYIKNVGNKKFHVNWSNPLDPVKKIIFQLDASFRRFINFSKNNIHSYISKHSFQSEKLTFLHVPKAFRKFGAIHMEFALKNAKIKKYLNLKCWLKLWRLFYVRVF